MVLEEITELIGTKIHHTGFDLMAYFPNEGIVVRVGGGVKF